MTIRQNTSRIEYVDSVKGFAILLMLFGHMKFHDFNWFIYSFHMPLFYIISGFFFNPAKSSAKRIHMLMRAYVVTCIAMFLIQFPIRIMYHLCDISEYSIKELLLCISAYVSGCVKPVGLGNYLIPDVGPIWFLMALSLGIFIYRVLFKLNEHFNLRKILFVECLLLAILGWSISLLRGQVPFSINQALVVPLYLFVGNKIKIELERSELSYSLVFASVLLWIILLYFQIQIQFMSMGQMGTGFFPVYILGSIAASYLVILCFKTFHHVNFKILKLIGTETLIILCVHCVDLFAIEPNVELYFNRLCLPLVELVAISAYKFILYTILLFFILKKRSKTENSMCA